MTDNVPALQAAMNAAVRQDLPVFLSPGVWFANVKGWTTLKVPPGLEIYGTPSTLCTWPDAPYGYPYFAVYGANVYIHDLSFQHPTGHSAITSQANLSNLRVANCNFQHSCINRLFACVDSLIENCNVNGAIALASTAQSIEAGTSYTALEITPLSAPVPAKSVLYLYVYPNGVFRPGTFKRLVTVAAANTGDSIVQVEPFVTELSLPPGALLQKIVVATGLAMTGQYSRWGSPFESGNYCVNSTISGCTVLNCNAANVFINMGYQCSIENCVGVVGHDMNFDFEYCVECTMQNNTGWYGGNRGIAVETINSRCTVVYNTVSDVTSEDGIRVTTDLIPAGNPLTVGGHTVAHNTVTRAYWGIAFQGTFGTIEDNTIQYCRASGVQLQNLGAGGNSETTTVQANTITNNYGVGIELLNASNVVISQNDIAYNGYVGGPPAVAAPVLALTPGYSSLVGGQGYAVAIAWEADVSTMGTVMRLLGPPSLPGFITPSGSEPVITCAVSPPAWATGIAVFVTPQSWYEQYTWYLKPADDWKESALAVGGLRLGTIDLSDGSVAYSGSADTGLSATLLGGTVQIAVTAPAAADGTASRGDSLGAGVWFNAATGGDSGALLAGNQIHDNGYAGVYGVATGVTISGGTVENHTAFAVWNLRAFVAESIAMISGSYQGLFAGTSVVGGSISGCTFSDITTDCIRYEGAIDGQSTGMQIRNNVFGRPLPVGTGIYIDANRRAVHPADPPGIVEGNIFADVAVPIDLNGGAQPVLTIASGNVGLG